MPELQSHAPIRALAVAVSRIPAACGAVRFPSRAMTIQCGKKLPRPLDEVAQLRYCGPHFAAGATLESIGCGLIVLAGTLLRSNAAARASSLQ